MLGKFYKGRLKKCYSCGHYTLKEVCPICNKNTEVVKVPKYSPKDKYGAYRRLMKKWKAQK
jgi:H/ACA ribonucleoprotein complex subunit 3